jgi:hypothetical protein
MQVSWIDPESLRANLDALRQPPQAAPTSLSHLEAGPALDSWVAALTSAPPPAAPAPEPVAPTAPASPPLPGTISPALLTSLRGMIDRIQSGTPLRVDPPAPLGRRLAAFAAWARQLPAIQEVLVLDNDGHLLWGPPQPAQLRLAALMAMNAGLRNGDLERLAPRLQRPFTENQQLSLIACTSQAGALQLAVVHQGPLIPGTEASLGAALTAAVDAIS